MHVGICVCTYVYKIILIYKQLNDMDFIPILLMRKHAREKGKEVIQDPKAKGELVRLPRLCSESSHDTVAVLVKPVRYRILTVPSASVVKT